MGVAVLGERLRWRDRGRARLRAAGVAAARPRAAVAHGAGCSSGVLVARGAGGGRWSTSCARPTSAPTSASSSRRRAPTSGARSLVLRRKATREPVDARPLVCCSCSRRRAVLLASYLVAGCDRARLRTLFAEVSTARATAIALGVVARARVRAERLRHHHPRDDGGGDRSYGRDPASRVVFRIAARSEPGVAHVTVVRRVSLVGLVTVRFLRIVSGEILVVARAGAQELPRSQLATAGGLFIILTVLVIDAGRVGARRARGRLARPASPRRGSRCCSRCSASASSA